MTDDIPSPLLSDAPNGPLQMQAIAVSVDGLLAAGGHLSLQRTGTVTIPDSAWTIIGSWTVLESENFTFAAGVATVQTPGWYTATGQLTYPPNGSPVGQRVARLQLNGTDIALTSTRADAAFNATATIGWAGPLNVGDQLAVHAYQSQGASVTLLDMPWANRLFLQRVGP